MAVETYDSFERSDSGNLTKAIFLDEYSDIVIYVEDTARCNIYETLFKRLLNGSMTIERIFLSGGKSKLIELYKEYKKDPKTPCFFLADSDYDEFLDIEKISDENFAYLERYSIENYLIDAEVGSVFLNSRLQIGEIFCKEKIDFENWIEKYGKNFKQLNSLFMAIQKLKIGISNTNMSAEAFLVERSWDLDGDKIKKHYEKALAKAISMGIQNDFHSEIESFNSKQENINGDKLWVSIPGKQLITIFWKYLVCFCPKEKRSINLDDFYQIAANVVGIEPLLFLKSSINNYLEKWHFEKSYNS